ncbi:hypothetical protein PHLGIDRAFT_186833 [Phlebiopsis gigantea 11061_1 CR5-6]|uniref:Uncharacterized protein n=1 Tax=Phlebiopsis gigantea (strain 11061_1 CR5-6) TaxID=745531 RepID=A0A0C3SEU6_PHLG1|nr:hypothetical protein PHLGIDRAFT_186833 [Phlebiopsis gigantea 11061_1 CR5-6]
MSGAVSAQTPVRPASAALLSASAPTSAAAIALLCSCPPATSSPWQMDGCEVDCRLRRLSGSLIIPGCILTLLHCMLTGSNSPRFPCPSHPRRLHPPQRPTPDAQRTARRPPPPPQQEGLASRAEALNGSKRIPGTDHIYQPRSRSAYAAGTPISRIAPSAVSSSLSALLSAAETITPVRARAFMSRAATSERSLT